mgnify:CR=1 FL=1
MLKIDKSINDIILQDTELQNLMYSGKNCTNEFYYGLDATRLRLIDN